MYMYNQFIYNSANISHKADPYVCVSLNGLHSISQLAEGVDDMKGRHSGSLQSECIHLSRHFFLRSNIVICNYNDTYLCG